jgi:DMSO/TMAO reductase YedYZ molybdopterin-dependent catalytic subunit
MSLLAIDGAINLPRSFTLEELRALPQQIKEHSVLLGGCAIIGVRLTSVVTALGIKPWARFAVVRGEDGYVANIPVEAIDDCVLVYAVGREPLPEALGGPARLLGRGLGRCANVKRVQSVSLAEHAAEVAHPCRHEAARVAGPGH